MIKATIIKPVQTYTVDTVILYDFWELNKDLQNTIIEAKRKELYNDSLHGYYDRQDFFENMNKIFDIFNCQVCNDSYDRLYLDTWEIDSDIANMSFKRCMKYILKVYNLREYTYGYKQRRKKLVEKLNKLHDNKIGYYSYKQLDYNGNSIKVALYPELQPVTAIENYTDNCSYYTDYCFFDALKAFIKQFSNTKDYNLSIINFLNCLLNEYKKEWKILNDNLYSDEYIKEFFLNENYYDKLGDIVDNKIIEKRGM